MIVVDPLHIAQLRQQLAAVQVGVHFTACRARGVQRHFYGLAAVLELHLADKQQELGQLVGSGRQGLDLFQRVRLVLEQVGVMFAQHARARA
ncbi:hypothetical protein D9M71_773930 [compost metagenome]